MPAANARRKRRSLHPNAQHLELDSTQQVLQSLADVADDELANSCIVAVGLAQKDKITRANAFDLNIIQDLHEMFRRRRGEATLMPTTQVKQEHSGTLQDRDADMQLVADSVGAALKVYSCRVDNNHKGVKSACHEVGNTKQKQTQAAAEDNSDDESDVEVLEPDDDEEKSEKPKKKRVTAARRKARLSSKLVDNEKAVTEERDDSKDHIDTSMRDLISQADRRHCFLWQHLVSRDVNGILQYNNGMSAKRLYGASARVEELKEAMENGALLLRQRPQMLKAFTSDWSKRHVWKPLRTARSESMWDAESSLLDAPVPLMPAISDERLRADVESFVAGGGKPRSRCASSLAASQSATQAAENLPPPSQLHQEDPSQPEPGSQELQDYGALSEFAFGRTPTASRRTSVQLDIAPPPRRSDVSVQQANMSYVEELIEAERESEIGGSSDAPRTPIAVKAKTARAQAAKSTRKKQAPAKHFGFSSSSTKAVASWSDAACIPVNSRIESSQAGLNQQWNGKHGRQLTHEQRDELSHAAKRTFIRANIALLTSDSEWTAKEEVPVEYMMHFENVIAEAGRRTTSVSDDEEDAEEAVEDKPSLFANADLRRYTQLPSEFCLPEDFDDPAGGGTSGRKRSRNASVRGQGLGAIAENDNEEDAGGGNGDFQGDVEQLQEMVPLSQHSAGRVSLDVGAHTITSAMRKSPSRRVTFLGVDQAPAAADTSTLSEAEAFQLPTPQSNRRVTLGNTGVVGGAALATDQNEAEAVKADTERQTELTRKIYDSARIPTCNIRKVVYCMERAYRLLTSALSRSGKSAADVAKHRHRFAHITQMVREMLPKEEQLNDGLLIAAMLQLVNERKLIVSSGTVGDRSEVFLSGIAVS